MPVDIIFFWGGGRLDYIFLSGKLIIVKATMKLENIVM